MKKTFLRKITATFLAMVMAVIILPFQAAADPGGDGWAFDSATGNLIISTDAGMADWIENGWHHYKSDVKNVEIGDGVTSIGNSAFEGCTSLSSITIPSSVTSIGNDAFYGCTDLESITIPSSVTIIDEGAFFECTSLKEVEFLGNTPPSLGVDVFAGSTTITRCYVPFGTKTAYEAALGGILPYSAEIIESAAVATGWAFDSSTGKLKISTNSGTTAWRGSIDKTTISSVELTTEVTSIGFWAFGYCENLESITIPSSVTIIDESAFFECTSLNTVAFSETSQLKSIGFSAFGYCENLESITIPSSVGSVR